MGDELEMLQKTKYFALLELLIIIVILLVLTAFIFPFLAGK